MIKAVVYDCDGVIVDSREAILAYYDWMMDCCGLPPIDWSQEDIRQKALSMADEELLALFAGGDNIVYEKMLYIARNEYKESNYKNMALETGIREGLEIVSEKGLPMAVFTNRGKSLGRLLNYFELTDYFKMFVTARDVTLPKPSPEGLLKICDSFGIIPAEILFIGDSPTDYQAAKACGATFAAFKNPLWDAPVIHDHREIVRII